MVSERAAADRFLELRPFYGLCWLTVLGIPIALATVGSSVMAGHLPPTLARLFAAVVLVAVPAGAVLLHRRSVATDVMMEATANAGETRLLRQRLEMVRTRLRELCG